MTAAATATFGPAWVEAELAAAEASREDNAGTRRGLLDRISQRRADVRAAEADELVAITEWADLHRTDAGHDLLHRAVGLYPAVPHGSWDTCPVDMSGIPVDEYSLAELATTLEVTDGTARTLVEDALELRERLPRTWARVVAVQVPVWKARLVARRTLSMSPEAADYVDRDIAQHLHKLSPGRIKNVADAAILRFDPARAAAEAAEAGDNRGVWFDLEHGATLDDEARPDGTGRFGGVADTPDLLAFKDALECKAGELAVLGDDSSEQVRMSKAIGILADSQYSLDLSAAAAALEQQSSVVGPVETSGSSAPADRRPRRRRSPLGLERPIHLHLHTSSETARVQASGLPHAASPVAKATIERWLAELAPGVKVKVTPVINLNDHYAVDEYEAPAHIKARVDLRDHTCVFPFCTRRARFDRDHIDPYVDPEEGGPPGQTADLGLAKLCRYHHRVKTHGGWRYRRSPVDLAAYQWVSPLGDHYLVDGTGTTPLT